MTTLCYFSIIIRNVRPERTHSISMVVCIPTKGMSDGIASFVPEARYNVDGDLFMAVVETQNFSSLQVRLK